MPPIHQVRGSGRDPFAGPGAPRTGTTAPDPRKAGQAPAEGPGPSAGTAPPAGPLARAAELELRLREECLRRERAEARARHAEDLAEVAAARVALLERHLAATAGQDAEGRRERDARAAEIRDELGAVARELDALREEAVAADGRALTAARPTGPGGALRSRTALDPSVRMGELARGARELLAGGRIEAADEVIRGLEDAASRLRAQAPPPAEQP